MADPVDIANDYLDNELSRALKSIQKNTVPKIGPEYCKECDDVMPTERRQLGFQLCVPCAQEAERRERI